MVPVRAGRAIWIATAVCAGLSAIVGATPSTVLEPARVERELCGAPASPREFHYIVSGRIRPVLVWTGRRPIGVASVELANSARNRRISLLIGTDPAQAPMKMNRWGYAVETTCGEQTQVFGLMTQSDESTIKEASVALDESASERHYYRAIRATVDADSAHTETVRVAVSEAFTYRDLQRLIDVLPPPGAPPRVSPRPPDAAPGFLNAVADLLLDDGSGRSRAYLHAGQVYDLEQVSSKRTTASGANAGLVESRYRARNRATREETHFEITSATSGDLSGIPLRVVYRPKWWLELELKLDS